VPKRLSAFAVEQEETRERGVPTHPQARRGSGRTRRSYFSQQSTENKGEGVGELREKKARLLLPNVSRGDGRGRRVCSESLPAEKGRRGVKRKGGVLVAGDRLVQPGPARFSYGTKDNGGRFLEASSPPDGSGRLNWVFTREKKESFSALGL